MADERKWKQTVIVRKDLNMSHGKLAAQVSHASMAFLTTAIRKAATKTWDDDEMRRWIDSQLESFMGGPERTPPRPRSYEAVLTFEPDMYENWIEGAFVKCILEAKSKGKLLKAVEAAEEAGMREGEDFFVIRDNCRTELTPEEEDGTTITCVGFRPMRAEEIDPIGRKFQLYRD